MPRYKRFGNVSLKLSSLNKSSYEWPSKAIFNAFFALKSSEIYRHSPERNQTSSDESWVPHWCNKQL